MCTNNTTINTIINTAINTTPCNVEILQGVAYSPLFLLGFMINVAALRACIAQRDSWTDTHIYITNLAIADFFLIVFLPFRIVDAFICLSKSMLCTVLVSIHYINMYASIYTSMAISVQRYLFIRFPVQAKSWTKNKLVAVAVCLAIWVSVVTVCIIFSENNYPDKLWTCYERCRNRRLQLQFVVILVTVGFFAPLFIVVFCTSQIICTVLKETIKPEEMKSTISIVTANMIVFIVCYTPIHISFIVSYFSEASPDWELRRTLMPEHVFLLVSEWIASTNCCLDSISYYFLLKRYYKKRQAR